MELSSQTKIYLTVISIISILAYFIYDSSKYRFSCDEWANSFRDDKSINLILTGKENHEQSRNSYLYGIDMGNHRQTNFFDGSGWITRNFDKLYIGDTVIKQKGKYTITIKRNGKTILIPYKCDEKTYHD